MSAISEAEWFGFYKKNRIPHGGTARRDNSALPLPVAWESGVRIHRKRSDPALRDATRRASCATSFRSRKAGEESAVPAKGAKQILRPEIGLRMTCAGWAATGHTNDYWFPRRPALSASSAKSDR